MVFGTDVKLNSEVVDVLIKEQASSLSSKAHLRNNLRKALRRSRR